jgi:hypothetical protein
MVVGRARPTRVCTRLGCRLQARRNERGRVPRAGLPGARHDQLPVAAGLERRHRAGPYVRTCGCAAVAASLWLRAVAATCPRRCRRGRGSHAWRRGLAPGLAPPPSSRARCTCVLAVQEIFTVDELSQKFSLDRITKSAAVFDKVRRIRPGGKGPAGALPRLEHAPRQCC